MKLKDAVQLLIDFNQTIRTPNQALAYLFTAPNATWNKKGQIEIPDLEMIQKRYQLKQSITNVESKVIPTLDNDGIDENIYSAGRIMYADASAAINNIPSNIAKDYKQGLNSLMLSALTVLENNAVNMAKAWYSIKRVNDNKSFKFTLKSLKNPDKHTWVWDIVQNKKVIGYAKVVDAKTDNATMVIQMYAASDDQDKPDAIFLCKDKGYSMETRVRAQVTLETQLTKIIKDNFVKESANKILEAL